MSPYSSPKGGLFSFQSSIANIFFFVISIAYNKENKMSELTYEELQERLSVEGDEIFYTANDGETYQIGSYEMQTDWYKNDYSSQIANAYLLSNLYEGIPIYSDDEDVFAVSDMRSYDMELDVRDFLDTYFREGDIDVEIFSISDITYIDLDDLPEDVLEELEEYDEDEIIEAFRDSGLLKDDFDYCYDEARKSYAEAIKDEVKSKMRVRYENGGYPLSGGDIDFSKIDSPQVLEDIRSASSEWDGHKKLFLTGNEDWLLSKIAQNEFYEGDLQESFQVEAILELAKNLSLKNDREFFLAHTQSDYGSNQSILVRFASEELKADKSFAMQWLEASKNMKSLQCFSDDLRSDLQVIKCAVENNYASGWSNFPEDLLPEVASKELAEGFKIYLSERQANGQSRDFAASDFINTKIAEKFMHKLDDMLPEKPITKAQKLSDEIEDEDFTYKPASTQTSRTKL